MWCVPLERPGLSHFLALQDAAVPGGLKVPCKGEEVDQVLGTNISKKTLEKLVLSALSPPPFLPPPLF